ncbi:craniofacial development protein 2-like [Culex pipiens pallens]|uniref:craniofacial development protein 2-like n=1 Tax=Culex pipiens pallens TaxID=42434 RepID=UPI0022AAD930|nr:craniofacial development protein 2-like [Culex pipiens pallens]
MHGVGFVVIGDQKNRVIKWKVVNDRICVLRIKGKFFNYSLINIYAPTNDKPDDDEDAFYERLDKTYGECPRHDVKIGIGDANAQVGRKAFFHPVIGKESLYPRTNDNGLRLEHWRYPNGESCTQIDYVLVDGRHFSDVMDVQSYRGPNIDSDHFLVACKIRARLSNVLTPRTARIARLNVQRLASSDVAAEYSRKLDERINEDAPTASTFFMAWSLTSCRRCSISIDKKRAISDRERCSLAGGGCVDSVPAVDNLDPCTTSSRDYCNVVETTS